MAPGHRIDEQKKHKQCEICGMIEIDEKWFLPLEAITKGVKPDLVTKFSECPQCKDKVTLNIIVNAFPAIAQ